MIDSTDVLIWADALEDDGKCSHVLRLLRLVVSPLPTSTVVRHSSDKRGDGYQFGDGTGGGMGLGPSSYTNGDGCGCGSVYGDLTGNGRGNYASDANDSYCGDGFGDGNLANGDGNGFNLGVEDSYRE